jgi:cytochrome b
MPGGNEARRAAADKIAVWDVPVRLFHWLLAGLIVFAWWSAESDRLTWHKIAGSCIAGLLVFRLWWGVFGGSTARFAEFLRGPKTVMAYLSGRDKSGRIGHNPLGALSVVALLLTCATIVVAGLFAVDTDGLESGPLSAMVDYDSGRLASKIHGYGFEVLEILIGLHILAVLFYSVVKRRPLIPAMLHGKMPAAAEDTPLRPGGVLSLAIGLALGVAAAAGLIYLSGKG